MEEKILTSVDSLRTARNQDNNILGVESSIDNNALSIVVHLADEDVRTISTSEFVQQWRQELGDLIGVESAQFESDIGGPGRGKALTVELSHRHETTLQKAGEALAEIVSEYAMVSDISDGFTEGKQQFDFILLPRGDNLGLTSDDISRQVRAAFYGSEASRQQRGRHEIKVLVRLADEYRQSEYDINQLKEPLFSDDKYKIIRLRVYYDLQKNCSFLTRKHCLQGSLGIRQWPINLCTMYIPNDNAQNYLSVDYK